MIDVYENPKYFFMVLDMLKGGDMHDYLEERDFHISETLAKRFIKEIANGL